MAKRKKTSTSAEGVSRRKAKPLREYLTARVSAGMRDRFLESIPPGYNVGYALDVVLEIWLGLPEPVRLRALMGEIGPSLCEVVSAIVDERVQDGSRTGRFLSQLQQQTPSERDSRRREPEPPARSHP